MQETQNNTNSKINKENKFCSPLNNVYKETDSLPQTLIFPESYIFAT